MHSGLLRQTLGLFSGLHFEHFFLMFKRSELCKKSSMDKTWDEREIVH